MCEETGEKEINVKEKDRVNRDNRQTSLYKVMQYTVHTVLTF